MYDIDKRNVFWKKVDDDAVILNIDTGFYFSLDEVGTYIWEKIAEGVPEEAIIASISDQYGVKPEMVAGDLKGLLKDLIKEELIVKK